MRLLKKACLLLAGAVTAAGVTVLGAGAPASAADCSHVYFLADGHLNGTTGATWDVNHTVAPPGAHLEKFLYDDGIIPVVEPHDLDTTQKYAGPALEKKVTDFHQSCPGTPITLVGYSFGALISGNVVASLASKNAVPHNLLNAVLIADPRHAVHTSGVEGPAGGIMSVAPDGPGMHTTGPRNFGDIKVANICRHDDIICNAVNPVSNAQGFIGEMQRFNTAHTAYGDPDPNRSPWHNPAAFENSGDLMLAPSAPITWGGPAFPAPMPRDVLNSNPVYQGVIDGLSKSGDTLDWANVLNSFGLPGDQVIHEMIAALEAAGKYW
ncbi:cutinase family protein [Amycolatopsis sp. WGS_07]|uniref:cutinase family protein n=1 Tax=Amycolatopsis sp. WGS_07 TaxID=3076764 RepID=UPI003872CC80